MEHTHGNEYQIVIIHQDGTEELSGWMNSDEQVAQTMAGPPGHQAMPTGFGKEAFSVPIARTRHKK
jgi:hypothetical protein